MIKKYLFSFIFLTCVIFAQDTAKWITPEISGYGKITYDPNLALIPKTDKDYKVIFKITNANEKEGVNSQLWHIARLVNLLSISGVKKKNIHIVAVISGDATPVVLNDIAYKKIYKKSNPNIHLINSLKDAGVELYVCSQAASERHFDFHQDINEKITVSLSALTTLIYFQQLEYILIQ
ncbi:DsrE family protein [Sulfurovum sp. zt1-1]|uniref:DsrE family protein n=1 Tax=Sulfurovum zhangzhouensis TaxID=3019067 RepID=A0ABT7QV22_9BACT|nr:DsrE family protein [Sulfurovum zhangzhouensis]MDM5270685.1 DsrE family protein [Sulfurovum zhangzhouensis]